MPTTGNEARGAGNRDAFVFLESALAGFFRRRSGEDFFFMMLSAKPDESSPSG